MNKLIAFFLILPLYASAELAWVNPKNVLDPRFDSKTGHYKSTPYTDTSLEFRNFKIPPYRATLRDRNGVVLAHDEYFHRAAIWLEGGDLNQLKERFYKDLKILSDLLGREIRSHEISSKMFEERRGTPIVFNQQLSPKEFQKIKSAGLPRIRVLETTKRKYPHGEKFSHAVGWAAAQDNISDALLFYPAKGRSGLESLLDSKLAGRMGLVEVMRDTKDYEIKMIFESKSRASEDLVAGLDVKLQNKVYEVLRGKLTSGVVLIADATTGEIPVMMSLPSFNPSLLIPFVDSTKQKEYLKDPLEPMANRIYRNYLSTSWESLKNSIRFKDDFEYFVSESAKDYSALMGFKEFKVSENTITPLFLLCLLQRLTLSPALKLVSSSTNLQKREAEDLALWSYPDFTSIVERIGSVIDGTGQIIKKKIPGHLYLGTSLDKKYNMLIISEDLGMTEARLLDLKAKIESVLE